MITLRPFSNRFRLLLTALAAFSIASIASAQSIFSSYDPNVDGNVNATRLQPDGKLLVGGKFTLISPLGKLADARGSLARIESDGSLDTAFNPTIDGTVYAVALQTDGKVLAGGLFSSVQPGGTGDAIARENIVRLNADGSLDAAFAGGIGGGINPEIRAIAIQSDGRIVVAGHFTQYTAANGTVTPRNNLLRLNADGSLDTTFDPSPNNYVFTLLVDPADRIIVGGNFTTIKNGVTTVALKRLVRLESDGSVDLSFDVNPDNRVLALLRQDDGSIIAGGEFRNVQATTAESSTQRTNVLRVKDDGSLDTTFFPRPSGSVSALAAQPDGGVLLGGLFRTVLSPSTGVVYTRNFLARIDSDGDIDTAFTTSPSYAVTSIAVEQDGRILIAGQFTAVQATGSGSYIPRNRLARLNSDGTVDTSFNPDSGSSIRAVVAAGDGSVYVAGNFVSLAGGTKAYLAHVLADGTVDASFAPTIGGEVQALAVQSDGKLIIAGLFAEVNDTDRLYIARLNADGTLDPDFQPRPNSAVNRILVLSGGDIVLGGSFTSFDPDKYGAESADTSNTIYRSYVARLSPAGIVNQDFVVQPNSAVSALYEQADGKIVVGGPFTVLYDGSRSLSRNGVARVDNSGKLDLDFSPTLSGSAERVKVLSTGKILLSGTFTTVLPSGDTDADNAVDRAGLVLLNADGTIDLAFNPNFNSSVYAISELSDGRLAVGGIFSGLTPDEDAGLVSVRRLAVLAADGSLDSSFTYEPNSTVLSILPTSDGGFYAAGVFSRIVSREDSLSVIEGGLVKFTAAGAIDGNFAIRTALAANPAYVSALTRQENGLLLIGGKFDNLGGSTNQNLARFTVEGSRDTSFSATTDGAVSAIAVLPKNVESVDAKLFAWLEKDGDLRSTFDPTAVSNLTGTISVLIKEASGSYLVGGSFSDPTGVVPTNLARFSATGQPDTSFAPAPSAAVTSLALEADGDIIVGGGFTTIGGQEIARLARITAAGAVDTTFKPTPNSQVNAILVLADGKIVVGGAFTSFLINGATDSTTRAYLTILNTDGTILTGYDVIPNGTVRSLVQDSESRIVFGGSFTNINSGGVNTALGRVARMSSAAVFDKEFKPNANSTVLVVRPLSGGGYLLGGEFTALQPNDDEELTTRGRFAKIDNAGDLDLTVNPNFNGSVNTISLQSDGKILIGGGFSALNPNEGDTYTTRNNLARLNTDGTLDLTYNPNATGRILAINVADDDSALLAGDFTSITPEALILVAGGFNTVGELALPKLARINVDGNPDSRFSPAPNADVNAILPVPGNYFITAGAFTEIAGTGRSRIARFTRAGDLDTAYAPVIDNGTAYALALASDGSVLVGGTFTQAGGVAHAGLARILPDGSIDAAFAPQLTGGQINAIAVQANGRILVGGAFQQVNGINQPNIVRLMPDGVIDSSFTLTTNATVSAISLLTDGQFLLGGAFTSLTSGATTVNQANFALVGPTGTVVESFDAALNGPVYTFAPLPGGNFFLGGSFSSSNGSPRYLVTRVQAPGQATQTIAVDENRRNIAWARGGVTPEVSAVQIAYSTDGITWSVLGAAQRNQNNSNWFLAVDAGVLPADTRYYLRATGTAATNRYASAGLLQYIAQFRGSVRAGIDPLFPPADPFATGNEGSDYLGVHAPNGDYANNNPLVDIGDLDIDGQLSRFVNLSIRINAAGTDTVITGFVIIGTEMKQMIVRAVGPGLADLDVEGELMENPQMLLYDVNGALLDTNIDWSGSADDIDAFASVGAFPLTVGSSDAAFVRDFAPGSYTVHATATDAVGGVFLAELYDAEALSPTRVVNISTRARVASGDGVAITGFVIGGNAAKPVLIRAVGPTLAEHDVTDFLADPKLRLTDQFGNTLAFNDNWGTQAAEGMPTQAELQAAFDEVYAFDLPANSADAAVIAILPPGIYTAQVTPSTDGADSGEVLIEIYELP